jgi:hypothetical protein
MFDLGLLPKKAIDVPVNSLYTSLDFVFQNPLRGAYGNN